MSSSDSPRILSVEDNSETRLILKHQLQEGYEVVFASGAEEAMDAISAEPFDLLLLDINLGDGKNGTELLDMVRGREDTEDIPAVALTAYAMPGDREELLDEGFDGYVSKPFTKAELAKTIDGALSDA